MVGVLAVYALLRMLFLFTEVALQRYRGFRPCWELTRKALLKLFSMFFVIGVVYWVLMAIVDVIFGNLLEVSTTAIGEPPSTAINLTLATMLGNALNVVLRFFNAATNLAIVSSAYKIARKAQEDGAPETAFSEA